VHVLLSGIVGSTAYGLAGPDSDVDRLGIFTYDTERFFGLTDPADSHVSTKPDATFHEARKAAKLMLGCNPTASEILWLPNDLYEVRTPLGEEAIAIRSAFLSAGRVRAAYLGYAEQQFKRMKEKFEKLHQLQAAEAGRGVRPESAVPGREAEGLQTMSYRLRQSELLEEPRAVPPGRSGPAQALRTGGSSGEAGTASCSDVWDHPEHVRHDLATPEGSVPDLRASGRGGRSRPQHGGEPGTSMPEVQPRVGSLFGRSGVADPRALLPTGAPDGLPDGGDSYFRRLAKHARHLARLCFQGYNLYASGALTVRLEDPQWYRDFGVRVAAGGIDAAEDLLAHWEGQFDRAHSPLPDQPDERIVEDWLLRVRREHYTPEENGQPCQQ
jgi:hypothetical protein